METWPFIGVVITTREGLLQFYLGFLQVRWRYTPVVCVFRIWFCPRLSTLSLLDNLRTVPTIVTAHAFCASQDTRVSYGLCLLIQGYFCAV